MLDRRLLQDDDLGLGQVFLFEIDFIWEDGGFSINFSFKFRISPIFLK